jgi:putative membrane protein
LLAVGRLSHVKWVVPALVQWGINVLGLIVADWAFSGFSIERWGPLLLAGAVLGLANVFLKPLVTFIALPLILLTFGIAYFFVNVVMLLFTEWVVPDFSIDGFWTYVGATIVIWLVNWIVSQVVWSVSDNRP